GRGGGRRTASAGRAVRSGMNRRSTPVTIRRHPPFRNSINREAPLTSKQMTRTPDQVPQRPAEQLRADARQNHARLIAAATAAFAERGADSPLADIARRGGEGIGTLYRHL